MIDIATVTYELLNVKTTLEMQLSRFEKERAQIIDDCKSNNRDKRFCTEFETLEELILRTRKALKAIEGK